MSLKFFQDDFLSMWEREKRRRQVYLIADDVMNLYESTALDQELQHVKNAVDKRGRGLPITG